MSLTTFLELFSPLRLWRLRRFSLPPISANLHGPDRLPRVRFTKSQHFDLGHGFRRRDPDIFEA